MAQAIRTPRARRDLADIWHFIALDNVSAADRLIDSIADSLAQLADHPRMGPERAHLGRDVRSFPVGNYILYYRIISGGVELLRVLHGARDVRDLSAP
jgi:toxin ParE1/3/4